MMPDATTASAPAGRNKPALNKERSDAALGHASQNTLGSEGATESGELPKSWCWKSLAEVAADERGGGVGVGGDRQPPARHPPPPVHPPKNLHRRTCMNDEKHETGPIQIAAPIRPVYCIEQTDRARRLSYFIPLGVRLAAFTGAFRPGIAIRVQRHPLDVEPVAALSKFRGPVRRTHLAQIREQRPRRPEPAQDGFDFLAEMNERQAVGFPAGVADHAVGPVNVFRLQTGDVRLRAAQMPAQFVKVFALGVLLPLRDPLVFGERDGPFGFEGDFRPEPFGNERPGQPVHGQAKIMKFAQVDIGADGADVEGFQQVFRLCLDDDPVPDGVQRPVLGGGHPTAAGGTLFGGHDGVARHLPGARGHARIGPRQIGLGDLQVENGLAEGLILGEHDLHGRVAVLGFEAETAAGLGIDAVEGATAFAAVDQTETSFHRLRQAAYREVHRVVTVLRAGWRALARLGVRREFGARFGARDGTLPR